MGAPRAAIAGAWRADEALRLLPLIDAARPSADERERTSLLAQALVAGMRRYQGRRGVEGLARAFPLDSPAGLALLSLAEALLRVPDAANGNRLLRDRHRARG